MKIPKKVKVNGHIFRVEFQKENDLSIDADCGRTSRVKGLIAINEDLMQSQKEVTFFHEVIHIMNGEIKEESCDFWAESFYAFLKENKLLK